MNKKLLISIIAGVLALVLIVVGVVLIVKHRNQGVITFEDQIVNSGSTVRIPLIIKRNPGIWGGQVTLNYDQSALEFVSVSKGEVFDECEVTMESGKINLLITEKAIENSKQNGIIATINFNVKRETAPGDYKITVDKRTNFCNTKADLVTPEFEVGTITVK